jgi:hypothetical protein
MKRPSKKSPEQIAVDTVVKENGHQKPARNLKDSRKQEYEANFKIFKYKGLLGEEKTLFKSDLMKLAREYLNYCQEHADVTKKKNFWAAHGITTSCVYLWQTQDEDFAYVCELAAEQIGDNREAKLKFKQEENLAKRLALYIHEYRTYDKEEAELRERIRHQIEKDDQLNKFQIQEIINESMHIIKAKENADADKTSGNTK